MAMTFSFHEQLDFADTKTYSNTFRSLPDNSFISDEKIHLFSEKMCVPQIKTHLSLPRLTKLLEKSCQQFGATLIAGRAETGKTVLATDFAKNYSRLAWYQIESAETDWNLFSRYFVGMFGEEYEEFKETKKEVIVFVEHLLTKISKKSKEPLLIVLDDVHNVFDAEWFAEFFVSLLYTISPEIHVLMLSRMKPPQPLWRLRSKQVLGVIDEKLLALTIEETIDLFAKNGISEDLAVSAHTESFGRISRLINFIESN
ncbi:hypothetical protein BH10ACI1_BH10ACI1_14400 [soil metagenome]